GCGSFESRILAFNSRTAGRLESRVRQHSRKGRSACGVGHRYDHMQAGNVARQQRRGADEVAAESLDFAEAAARQEGQYGRIFGQAETRAGFRLIRLEGKAVGQWMADKARIDS